MRNYTLSGNRLQAFTATVDSCLAAGTGCWTVVVQQSNNVHIQLQDVGAYKLIYRELEAYDNFQYKSRGVGYGK